MDCDTKKNHDIQRVFHFLESRSEAPHGVIIALGDGQSMMQCGVRRPEIAPIIECRDLPSPFPRTVLAT